MAQLDDGIIRIEGVNKEFHRNRILLVLLIPLAMALMSISSINVAIPAIEQNIGAGPTDIQWLLAGYSLSFGIVLVAAGRVGDVLGRGITFIAGVSIFAFASLGCGLVSDPNLLNLMRFVQGIGAGLQSPQTNGMIVQYFKGQARATAFALFGLAVSASVAVAPLLTGLLIAWLGTDWGWRMSFLWNFPLGMAAVIMAIMWFPFQEERQHERDRRSGTLGRIKLDLDPVGILLLTLSVLGIMLPFIIHTPASFLLLVAGLLIIVCWVFWERRYKSRGHEPMVDLHLFQHRSFTNAIAVSAVQFMAITSMYAIVALFLQQGLRVAPIPTGLVTVPNAVASAIAAMIAGRFVLQKGRTLSVAALITSISGIAISIVVMLLIGSSGISFWWLSLTLILCGAGMGMLNSCNQTLSQLDIAQNVAGTAGGVKQTAERIGTAVGQAMLTAILFANISRGWVTATVFSYAAIMILLAISLALALYDLRTLGDPHTQAA